MIDKHWILPTLVLLAAFVASDASAQQGEDVYVPPELEAWRDWVLKDKEYLDCPFFFDRWQDSRERFVCAWPALLDLQVSAEGGSFRQTWTVYADTQWVPLPGDRGHWPEQVSVGGRGIEVVLRDGAPAVRLAPGRHTLTGRFGWGERPTTLAIPRQSGLLSLTVDGERVPRPDRNRNTVWLGETEVEETEQDALSTEVYRLVADDVPTRLVTVIDIDVSGGVREESLGPVLPDGLTPLALDSDLPARIEADGRLRIQVRPGIWQLRLVARAGSVLDTLGLPANSGDFPAAEVWSYRSNDRLRVTAAEGLPAIDPLQAGVPAEWEELPAFRIASGESLTLVERNRGRASTDNQLALEREMWLDFDGGGFAFVDRIGGQMQSEWRLDMAAPYEVHSAMSAGERLLVTLGNGDDLTGIEVRSPVLDVEAVGRSETRSAMPVSGWQTRFNGMRTSLHLPPGNKLLAALGADQSPGTWTSRWQLLDFFLVLITTVATLRLFGRAAAAVAFAALVLSWHESLAPQWIWLNLAVAVALVRVAPVGRLKNLASSYRTVSLAVLAVLLVPFVANELRIALFPQLEAQGTMRYAAVVSPDVAPYGAGDTRLRGILPAPQTDRSVQSLNSAASVEALEEITVTAARIEHDRIAPDALVRAGPGRPDWRWNTYNLAWDGPVDAARNVRFVILPRWLVTLLRVAEVLLIVGFAALFLLEVLGKRWRWPNRIEPGETAATSLAAIGAALLVGVTLSAPVQADTPSPDVLLELQQRLLEPPPCAPQCAEIVSANVDVSANELSVDLQVHALDTVAVSLPGSLSGWRPERISIDGTPVPHTFRGADDTLWVEVASGRRTISLEGPLPPVDSVTVPFPTTPRVVDVTVDGWFVSGTRDRRLTSGALQLTRLRADDGSSAAARWERNRFPTFVRIERSLDLGLDWTMTTRVIRVAPQRGSLTVNVPLLADESVLSDTLPIEDGEVTVSMDPNRNVVEWTSNLPRTSPVTLTAATDAPWKDVWRVSVSHIWRVAFDGVPESDPAEEQFAVRVAEFYPRAAESLSLAVTRPAATSGGTVAFDVANLNVEAGERSRSANLELYYRATRGAQHVISLPENAELRSVSIDGRNAPLRAIAGELAIPIAPGEHSVTLAWTEASSIGVRTATPAVDLGATASNIHVNLTLPASRWILAATGMQQGPAILYWSELAAMALFALLLGRITLTPLDPRQWLLLGLGFSTFSWPVLMLVAVWLLAAGAHAKWSADVRWWQFNLVQLVLAGLTIAALLAIVTAVPSGLLGSPNMHITGNGSFGNTLRWFTDQSAGSLPQTASISLPLWVYKALILAWALWLSFALLRWLPWVWRCCTAGSLWQPRPKKQTTAVKPG